MKVLGEPKMNEELAQCHVQSDMRISKIFGYGEDAFTLWALKHRLADILRKFQDQTAPSDCLIFYRPSFGRSGGKDSAEFGEFDAVLASSENIYLVESKWDNVSRFKNDRITLRPEQIMRHHIFSWYITHWDKKYFNNWGSFMKEKMDDFQKNFRKEKKKIAPTNVLLAENLEFILTILQEHCKKFSSESNIKNVLLFFYNKKKSIPPTRISRGFNLVKIDYSQEIEGNFITLDNGR